MVNGTLQCNSKMALSVVECNRLVSRQLKYLQNANNHKLIMVVQYPGAV